MVMMLSIFKMLYIFLTMTIEDEKRQRRISDLKEEKFKNILDNESKHRRLIKVFQMNSSMYHLMIRQSYNNCIVSFETILPLWEQLLYISK